MSTGDAFDVEALLSRAFAPVDPPERLSLARSLALSPDLLILDEPTAGLDPDRSEGFVRLIKRLREEHRFAVVMVTHDLDTLFDLTDRVAAEISSRRAMAPGTILPIDRQALGGEGSGLRRQAIGRNQP